MSLLFFSSYHNLLFNIGSITDDTGCGDLDAGGLAIVVESSGEAAIVIELSVGIPVEGATVVFYISIEWTVTIVRMIEVCRHVHTVEDDATIAKGVALRVVGPRCGARSR